MRTSLARTALALSALVLLGACAELRNVRVAPLRTENSSAHRSMVSQFTPLASQHSDVNDGALLRAPEDRGRGQLWLRRP